MIVIDSFCGAGGVTEGFHRAKINGDYCVEVIIGINHDAKAILSHKANHPNTHHFVEDFRTIDPHDLLSILNEAKKKYPEAKVMFWMSAECTHHSKAKGGESRDADSRSLPEYAYKYIEILQPDIIGVENVVEFLDWGPLQPKVVKDKKGNELYCPIDIKKDKKTKKVISIGPKWVPIPERKKEYYNAWVEQIKSYGYHYDYDKLNAADYGAYTSRTRYFGFFSKEKDFIVFPEKTHSKDGKDGKEKWKAVKDVLDFSDEGISIFDRDVELVENTKDRIMSGLIKHVAGGKDEWLLKYNSVNGDTGRHNPPGVDEPCPVVSCQNRLGVIKAQRFISKYYGGEPAHKNISVDEPAHTIRTKDCQAIISYKTGRKHFISKQFSGHPESKNISTDGPVGAVTTIDHHALVGCDFIQTYYGNGGTSSVESPSPVIPTKDRCAVVMPRFLCSYNFKDGPKDINAPCPTLLTKDRVAIVLPKQIVGKCHFIDQQFGQSKPASILRPVGTITANPKYAICSCDWLLDTNYKNVGRGLDQPSPVITANRKHHYLVNPQFSSAGNNIEVPCFTLIARMDKRPPSMVTIRTDQDELPSFIKIIGNTIVYEIYENDSPKTKEIKEFMALYGLTDIKMRMLMVDELLRIMGFGDDYILLGSQTDKKKFIGNAVECTQSQVIAEAISMAIFKHLLSIAA
ncbi:DNA cytosine methyltransferase [Bacteroides sp. 224]|uniref:DNA cytosine methyltransferase n=1 Tax=Bacteroides sp. 224 TaxID=2302936 RepID=UPI00351B8D68